MIERSELRGVLSLVALVEADWLEDGSEDAHRVDIDRAGERAQANILIRKVRQPEYFESHRHYIEPAVHVGYVANIFRRPEALGYGRRARPDARVDGPLIELLAPHADFAAEDERTLLRRQIGVGRQRVG